MSYQDAKDAADLTMGVPAAGKKYFKLGRNASYEAAKRGEIPTVRIGGRVYALVTPLERRLRGDTQSNVAA